MEKERKKKKKICLQVIIYPFITWQKMHFLSKLLYMPSTSVTLHTALSLFELNVLVINAGQIEKYFTTVTEQSGKK